MPLRTRDKTGTSRDNRDREGQSNAIQGQNKDITVCIAELNACPSQWMAELAASPVVEGTRLHFLKAWQSRFLDFLFMGL